MYLFTGDFLQRSGPEDWMVPVIGDNRDKAIQSLQKLSDIQFDALLTGVSESSSFDMSQKDHIFNMISEHLMSSSSGVWTEVLTAPMLRA